MEKGPESRVAKVRAVRSKRKSSADKKKRRKYRKLAEVKAARVGEVEEAEERDMGADADVDEEQEVEDALERAGEPGKGHPEISLKGC